MNEKCYEIKKIVPFDVAEQISKETHEHILYNPQNSKEVVFIDELLPSFKNFLIKNALLNYSLDTKVELAPIAKA